MGRVPQLGSHDGPRRRVSGPVFPMLAMAGLQRCAAWYRLKSARGIPRDCHSEPGRTRSHCPASGELIISSENVDAGLEGRLREFLKLSLRGAVRRCELSRSRVLIDQPSVKSLVTARLPRDPLTKSGLPQRAGLGSRQTSSYVILRPQRSVISRSAAPRPKDLHRKVHMKSGPHSAFTWIIRRHLRASSSYRKAKGDPSPGRFLPGLWMT